MSDNLSISNVNSAQSAKVNNDLSKSLNLVAAKKGSFVANQDVSTLARKLADKLGIPETLAFRVVRNFLTSGTVPNLKALEDYILQKPELRTAVRNANKVDGNRQNQNLIAKAGQEEAEPQVSLRPLLKEIKVNLNREKQSELNKLIGNNQRNLADVDKIPVSKLVSSPQAFASWLVNNKAAFIALKANPNATYLLAAMQNPILLQSPVMVSELSKLIAQLFKLKQGKQNPEALDDKEIEDREQEFLLNASNRAQSIVNNLQETSDIVGVNAMKDFLLEAERFAEEEVANLWSLVLKKEREISKKLKEGMKNVR